MSGQTVGYARVSSTSQNLARQLEGLGEVDEIFTDRQSGKSRAERAGLSDALRYVRRGDTLRVVSMDRLARSLIDLEQIVSDLTARKVTVEFVKERLAFSPDAAADPFATFQRQLIGAIAELERSLIRERQREGIELAKKNSVYKGRKRRLSDEQILHVGRAAAAGETKAKIATDLGVSRRLIYDVLAGNGAYAAKPPTPGPALPHGEEIPLQLAETQFWQLTPLPAGDRVNKSIR